MLKYSDGLKRICSYKNKSLFLPTEAPPDERTGRIVVIETL